MSRTFARRVESTEKKTVAEHTLGQEGGNGAPSPLADRLDIERDRYWVLPSAVLPNRCCSVHEGLNTDFLVLAVKKSSEGDGFDFHTVGQPFIEG